MASDIRPQHFIYRLTPGAWHPYLLLARVDRPVGTWLLLWPCLWSMALAVHATPGLATAVIIKHVLLFTCGAFFMRSAGCVINDLWDRNLDAQVARTRNRPLASGALSRLQAFVFLAGLLTLSLVILLQMNRLIILLGVASMALVVFYPVMKRITWWPQLFLGFTFNWGALMGYSALSGTLHVSALLLYLGGIFWTLAYDTIYAHQDIEDDIAVGVKSTAIRLGAQNRIAIVCFFSAALVLMTAAKGLFQFSWASLVFAVLCIFHIVWQLRNWREGDAASSLRVFKSNVVFGALALGLFYF